MKLLKSSIFLVAGILAWYGGTWAAEWLTPAKELVVLGSADVFVNHHDRKEPLEHEFSVHNPTRRPIQILRVEAGCSCMATKLDSVMILPGQTVPIVVRIHAFDGYKPTFREVAHVVSDVGRLVLQIRGTLPSPQEVRFRPDRIYVSEGSGDSVVERTVMIRVPKQCCGELRSDQIRLTDCRGVEADLVEEPSSTHYREFTIRLRIAVNPLAFEIGKVHLETGCGAVDVTIRKD
jgi:hypothetical protein